MKKKHAGFVKAHPVTNASLRKQWSAEHDRCMVCSVPRPNALWPGLETHHIIKPGRSDEPCNFLRLCDRCHRIIEGERVPMEHQRFGYWPKIKLGVVLWCKREHGEYDPVRLEELYHKSLPELEELPEAYLRERERWPAVKFGG